MFGTLRNLVSSSVAGQRRCLRACTAHNMVEQPGAYHCAPSSKPVDVPIAGLLETVCCCGKQIFNSRMSLRYDVSINAISSSVCFDATERRCQKFGQKIGHSTLHSNRNGVGNINGPLETVFSNPGLLCVRQVLSHVLPLDAPPIAYAIMQCSQTCERKTQQLPLESHVCSVRTFDTRHILLRPCPGNESELSS